ncbi:hypothetical protein [Terricaulis sp.]|uniref:hypothetical protein n=1 Tax=Terricaulis sp. TaxID=2768686 RepID=UPI003784D904
MMKRWFFAPVAALALLALASCNQQGPAGPSEPAGSEPVNEAETPPPQLPPVDAALVAAPNSTFVAFEPSEAGIIGAATVHEALGPIVSPESAGEGEEIHLTITEQGDTAVADIVRINQPDDAIASGHVRVEFRREPEGWYPTNAYRRAMCRRGAYANQWTTEACP